MRNHAGDAISNTRCEIADREMRKQKSVTLNREAQPSVSCAGSFPRNERRALGDWP
jgi:hypothetical protein